MDEHPASVATLDAPANGDAPERPVTSQISRAMVSVYKSQFGRGPVKAHTHWAGEDIIICVLEESLTPAEMNLRKLGEHARLRELRTLFQYASVKEFVGPIEQITGRIVRSFISGIDAEEDVSIETFVLYPAGAGQPSRAEKAPR